MNRRRVSRLGRKLDIVSLIFVVVGGSVYLLAFVGMRELRDRRETPFVPRTVEAFSALNEYYRLQKLSYLGLGIAGAGIMIGLSAAAHAHIIARRTAAPIS